MAMNSRAVAHVNRFRNYVAAFIGHSGATHYMHPVEAEKLAVALMAAAADVRRFAYAVSPFVPFEMELRPDGRENDVPGDGAAAPDNPLERVREAFLFAYGQLLSQTDRRKAQPIDWQRLDADFRAVFDGQCYSAVVAAKTEPGK